jgi:hypothetical protein
MQNIAQATCQKFWRSWSMAHTIDELFLHTWLVTKNRAWVKLRVPNIESKHITQPFLAVLCFFRGPTTSRTSHGNLAPNCSKGAWWLVNLTTAMVAEIIWMKSSGVLFHAMVWCKCDECHYAIKMQRFALTLGWARSKVYDHVGANI